MKGNNNSIVLCAEKKDNCSQMTHWGVGPKFGIFMITYGTLVIALSMHSHPAFTLSLIPHPISASIGIVLIIMGIPFYLFSLSSVMRAFKAGKLVTTGVYGMCRHPVYASWVIFFLPGIALLMNTWLGLTVPILMYFVLRALVKDEDTYLEKTFGPDYLAYRQKVPPVLPVGWIKADR
jgi:protein-S-isoprenylcysteine O-methyltransferase Ste14